MKSEASETLAWFRNTFDSQMDTVYILSNLYLKERIPDWRKRFTKPIDNTDEWKKERGTVPAKRVGKALRMARARFPGMRIIAHYMQPHRPYIGLDSTYKIDPNKKVKGVRKSLSNIVGSGMVSLFGEKYAFKLRKCLGWTPQNHLHRLEDEKGREALTEAYEKNLKIVLSELSKTVDRLPDDKIVVTADHGELLGEKGLYEHPSWSDHPVLKKVPWLEIEKESIPK